MNLAQLIDAERVQRGMQEDALAQRPAPRPALGEVTHDADLRQCSGLVGRQGVTMVLNAQPQFEAPPAGRVKGYGRYGRAILAVIADAPLGVTQPELRQRLLEARRAPANLSSYVAELVKGGLLERQGERKPRRYLITGLGRERLR